MSPLNSKRGQQNSEKGELFGVRKVENDISKKTSTKFALQISRQGFETETCVIWDGGRDSASNQALRELSQESITVSNCHKTVAAFIEIYFERVLSFNFEQNLSQRELQK